MELREIAPNKSGSLQAVDMREAAAGTVVGDETSVLQREKQKGEREIVWSTVHDNRERGRRGKIRKKKRNPNP